MNIIDPTSTTDTPKETPGVRGRVMDVVEFYQPTRGGRVHAALWFDVYHGYAVLLCGRIAHTKGLHPAWNRLTDPLPANLCRTCLHVADTMDLDLAPTVIDATRAARSLSIPDHAVREIAAKVYRVHGTNRVYTVTVPLEVDLHGTCTCMDAKTHPEVVCKHEAKVRGMMMKGSNT